MLFLCSIIMVHILRVIIKLCIIPHMFIQALFYPLSSPLSLTILSCFRILLICRSLHLV